MAETRKNSVHCVLSNHGSGLDMLINMKIQNSFSFTTVEKDESRILSQASLINSFHMKKERKGKGRERERKKERI
jgi:hypothetical protein